MEERDLVELTADIVSSFVSNNNIHVGDVPTVISSVHQALRNLSTDKVQAEPEKQKPEPAVSVRSSVKPDAITCLVCGRKQRTLKRHIATAHNMSPGEYRETFGLKPDYPMVAPNYSDQRRQMAVSLGLGRKEGEKAAPKRKPAKRAGRKAAPKAENAG